MSPRPAIESQARQVWLAGLGAMATTSETASAWLDFLVARGRKREPAAIAMAQKAARDTRRAVEDLAAEAGRRSLRLFDDAIERLGVQPQPRSRNILHRLGDVAEALL
jgi:hypothetical protein